MPPRPAAPARIAWTVAQMTIRPRARVLEIGCGSGHALALLASRAPSATLIGIDRSPIQVRQARERLASLVGQDRPVVEQLALEDAAHEWARHPFDVVLAINVNAFWTSPPGAVEALRVLLAPRGRVYLAYEPPTIAGRERLRRQVAKHLANGGLALEAEHLPGTGGHATFALEFRHAKALR